MNPPEAVSPPPEKPRSERPLWRLGASLLLNTLIAIGLTLPVTGRDGSLSQFWTNLLYAQCVGLSIWGLVDLGALALVREPGRQGRRYLAIVPVAVLLGYAGGSALADLLRGLPTGSGNSLSSAKGVALLLMSLTIGAACTLFFFGRARLAAAEQAAAQASAQAEAAQRQAAESQLKLLQTQLEPHMLFNTLANLRALVSLDPARAQTMLDHLIAYLRATLGASRATLHPLQHEFDRLADYLALMAVRMGTRLGYQLDLPAELVSVPVPPLLLQPLVENSIRHGLEPKLDGGHITVQALRQGTQLVLTVSDTGLGCPATPTQPAIPGASGFGLAQVRERLHTCYGDQAAIEIVAIPSGGTRVSISFPLKS